VPRDKYKKKNVTDKTKAGFIRTVCDHHNKKLHHWEKKKEK
jgi:hypothetical protein